MAIGLVKSIKWIKQLYAALKEKRNKGKDIFKWNLRIMMPHETLVAQPKQVRKYKTTCDQRKTKR